MKQPSRRVLVVEDDDVLRSMTVRALRTQGLTCDEAADGEQALSRLDEDAFDGVVTDLRMPRKHGHALCLELLARNNRPAIVVLTGVNDPRLEQDLKVRGVDAVFFKPVNFRMFATQVKDLLESRNSSEPLVPCGAPSSCADDSHRMLAMLGFCEEGSARSSANLDPSWLV